LDKVIISLKIYIKIAPEITHKLIKLISNDVNMLNKFDSILHIVLIILIESNKFNIS